MCVTRFIEIFALLWLSGTVISLRYACRQITGELGICKKFWKDAHQNNDMIIWGSKRDLGLGEREFSLLLHVVLCYVMLCYVTFWIFWSDFTWSDSCIDIAYKTLAYSKFRWEMQSRSAHLMSFLFWNTFKASYYFGIEPQLFNVT